VEDSIGFDCAHSINGRCWCFSRKSGLRIYVGISRLILIVCENVNGDHY
jgi:hypothetical protein